MKSILSEVFFDNTLQAYLSSLLIVASIFLLRTLLAAFLARFIALLVKTRHSPFNKPRFDALVLQPIQLFLMVLAVIIGFGRLQFPAALAFDLYQTSFHAVLQGAAKGILVAAFIRLCHRLMNYVGELLLENAAQSDDRTDDQLIVFFRDFFRVLLWIVGLLLILKFSFGFPLSNLLTGLSIVGAALALAFRESLENLIASFIIFFDKPFTIGDLVEIEKTTGTVEKIGLRSTRIRTTEKTYTSMPNKKMVDSVLNNLTLRTQRNVSATLELDLDTRPEQIAALVIDLKALLQHPSVVDCNAFFSDTGKAAHLVQVDYFVDIALPIKAFFELRQQLNLSILALLAQHGIQFAQAQATLLVEKKAPV
jgi:MscS family membrane protein